jgi:hypothetical protein
MSTFNKFEQKLKRYYAFEIKYKNESFFMKFLNLFVRLFNKEFMTLYVTTIGDTIYFPSRDFIENNEEVSICVLSHEVVHVYQAQKLGRVLFSTAYLFPQCLSLLSILAVFGFFWTPMLFNLLFLLFLAPIPAVWRKKFELEAYTITCLMWYSIFKVSGYDENKIIQKMNAEIDFIDKTFTGPSYFFMWPFGIQNELRNNIAGIQKGVISDISETYARILGAYVKAVSAYEL